MSNIISLQEARTIAQKLLDSDKDNQNRDFVLYLRDGEDWDLHWFFEIGVKLLTDNPAPVGGAMGIKVSKITQNADYVAFYEYNIYQSQKQVLKDVIEILNDYQEGQKINIRLRKEFGLSPSTILQINKELNLLDFDNEKTVLQYIEKLEDMINEIRFRKY